MLTPDQYSANVETISGSGQRVEYAIRLPGREHLEAVWLPIDAKFPKEAYERLLQSQEAADPASVLQAQKSLEQAIKVEAKRIREKYISPPQTTDFAIMFLPTESLYGEIVRIPGMVESIQQEYRVAITGPTTLGALLNSLQIGFRTLALEKRSTEIWQVLGAVKTEFGKFGDILAKTRETLEKAAKNIEQAEVRSRAMSRKLLAVESVETQPSQEALDLNATLNLPFDE
ncbi:unnamed protein product [Darwinula stevensoni]|uniref:DNA recombination protein RmuC n=1 Tax=Darwinula stevensoni TaxID=69355 RepID=A0A7R9FU41_9CRUS|nr:unnamed protein product [Darwinula stevensoni]CAG0908186.1 unnamed protein product [Darwinula stevensoni]